MDWEEVMEEHGVGRRCAGQLMGAVKECVEGLWVHTWDKRCALLHEDEEEEVRVRKRKKLEEGRKALRDMGIRGGGDEVDERCTWKEVRRWVRVCLNKLRRWGRREPGQRGIDEMFVRDRQRGRRGQQRVGDGGTMRVPAAEGVDEGDVIPRGRQGMVEGRKRRSGRRGGRRGGGALVVSEGSELGSEHGGSQIGSDGRGRSEGLEGNPYLPPPYTLTWQ